MLIIIEGIDRVGKTTLVDKIKKEINIESFRYDLIDKEVTQMDNETETLMMYNTVRMCNLTHVDLVLDRFCWSEYVYGCIEREYDTNKAKINLDIIENEIKKGNALFVLVKPTDIKWSSEQHGKDLTEYENLFELLFENTTIDKIECDYKSLDKVVDKIRKKI